MRANTSMISGMKNSELADSLSPASIRKRGRRSAEIADNAAVDRAAVRTNAEQAAGRHH
jgi:hypothetical protein